MIPLPAPPAVFGQPGLKARLALVSAAVLLLNGGGWLGACLSFGGDPALFAMALLVYGLGMRHGLDADHIAAIDNVTRKLMQEGERPVAVGFFFALGHSALVVLVAAAVGATAGSLELFRGVQEVGGYLGTGISALFLLTMALLDAPGGDNSVPAQQPSRQQARRDQPRQPDRIAQPDLLHGCPINSANRSCRSRTIRWNSGE
ncbi:hypothetical protein F1643_06150 [Azospirillum sp. INR13]|uniref:HoxN/HupN/NixA family nickel/cobalt transporter n=1 Tax=Azospirillum sp. INR13 TaxID=2596919 RepID=UPI00189256F3|nr:hypothetical protein [Azospirillum sp. INR13]MBF5094125.1 hypothetical protein [Azospirillum sp. INR13]